MRRCWRNCLLVEGGPKCRCNIIGTRLLGEQFGAKHVAAAGTIVAGLVLMNLRL